MATPGEQTLLGEEVVWQPVVQEEKESALKLRGTFRGLVTLEGQRYL